MTARRTIACLILLPLLYVAAVTALRAMFPSFLSDRSFWLLLLAGAAVAAWKGGLIAAVAAGLAGAVVAAVETLPPRGEPWIGELEHWLALALFLGLSIGLGLLSESRRRAHRRAGFAASEARRRRTELEFEVEQRKRGAVALRDSMARYRAIYESVLDGIITIDERGLIESANPAAVRLFGYQPEEMLGKNVSLLMPSPYREEHDSYLKNYLVSGRRKIIGIGREVVGLRKDGTIFPMDLAVSELWIEGRRMFTGLVRDITQRKRAAEELERAKTAAEEANRIKGQFLANVSHELRTPMNAILGMTELALDEQLPPEVRGYLETVKDSADALLGLLNEILDFSRLEAGAMSLETAPFGLRAMLGEVMKAMGIRARQKGLEPAWQVAADLPEGYLGDALRLRQILFNLLGNAIKFTERGEVVVTVSALDQSGPEVLLQFAVRDTGIGISAEQQQRIFAPFTQADASTTRHYGGTGLGLAIVSSLTALMGGRVWVESEPGKGSTFFFTVRLATAPAYPADEPGNGARQRPAGVRSVDRTASARRCQFEVPEHLASQTVAPSRPLRILVAEDTLANQKLIRRILQKRGHLVEVAANGREAVTLVRQQDFDVVLMDVQMPLMDGFQATAAIRALREPKKSELPIIALTAHAMRGDRERCLRAGMDDYVSKPLDSGKLVGLVETFGRGGLPHWGLPMDDLADSANAY